MVAHIYEYRSGQQHYHQKLERFYQQVYSKNKSRLLIQRILKHEKRKWFYGMVVIVAHAITMAENWSRQQKQISWLLLYYYRLTWIQVVFVELMLWSAGFSLAWYTWLSRQCMSRVNEKAKQAIEELDRVVLESKSNVWIMLPDHPSDDHILGVAVIRPCPLSPTTNSQQKEGLIQVTALTSQTQLTLVQTAIQFARQQDLKVIYTPCPEKQGQWFILE